MEKPLTNKKYLLKKIPGKGGWTYTEIPGIQKDKNTPFRWLRVRGTIDNIQIKNYHLMPMKNGNLFLPVKAEIRKKIRKAEGDWVHVQLYPDNQPVEISEEFQLCLIDEPNAYKIFMSYSDSEKKAFIDWIYSARREETKIDRITKSISKILKKERLTDKDNNKEK